MVLQIFYMELLFNIVVVNWPPMFCIQTSIHNYSLSFQCLWNIRDLKYLRLLLPLRFNKPTAPPCHRLWYKASRFMLLFSREVWGISSSNPLFLLLLLLLLFIHMITNLSLLLSQHYFIILLSITDLKIVGISQTPLFCLNYISWTVFLFSFLLLSYLILSN